MIIAGPYESKTMQPQHTRNRRNRKSGVVRTVRDYDLQIDLYAQLREVDRCLDRYPDQLPEAVRKLANLVRRYNPELAWRRWPSDAGRLVERMGEP